ncbi:MAG: hypothetical protein ACRERU_00250, partial [Methylococcales bacterium]
MSFLLDALRKSELERRVGEVPSLTPDLPIQHRSTQPKGHPVLLLITVLVLINAGTLLYIASHDRPGPKDPNGNPPSFVAPHSMTGSVEKAGSNALPDRSTKMEIPKESLSGAEPMGSANTPSPVTLADIAPTGKNQTSRQPSGLKSSGKPSPLDAENRGNRSLEEPFPVPQPTLSKQNQTSDRQKQPVDIGPPG